MKRWIVVSPHEENCPISQEFDAREDAEFERSKWEKLYGGDFYVAEVVANAPLPKGIKEPE